jgi:SAM-dependent methyltransferase
MSGDHGATGSARGAAGAFAAAAGSYATARPAYARAAVGLLAERFRGEAVLDVAAGTGILTGQLVRARCRMVAAEPLEPMLAQLRRALPSVPAVRATAESLPFAAGSFGAITVAQAFHWFDARRALAEAARLLAAGGTLALVFNVRDERVAWVRELTDLIEARSGGRPYPFRGQRPWTDVVADCARSGATGELAEGELAEGELAEGELAEGELAEGRWFGEGEEHEFPNPVPSSPSLLADRVRSTSFVAAMADDDRRALLDEVRDLVGRTPELAGKGSFEYPHSTQVHLWRRA